MLLAVDSSTQTMGLALFDGAQVVGEMIWQTHNRHTVELAPAVDELLKRCEVKAEQMQAVAVALGPGSFTSLRIGLALAKGLALALNIPIVGVPTLDILVAAQQLRDIPLAAVLQAGRNRLAVGWYGATRGRWQAQGEASVFTVEELAEKIAKPTLVCGELNALQRQVLAHKHKNVLLATPAQSLRRPSYLAEIGWKHWQSGKVDDVVSLAPIYLHVVEAIPA